MAGTSVRGAEPPLVLRPFQSKDEAGVVAVLEDTFHSTWAPQLRPQALERHAREKRAATYVRERGPEFLLACQAEAILGMVHWEGDFIQALHVTGAAQGRGVGRALLGHAEAQIAKAGRPCVRLETDTFNTRARVFYAALGYREVDAYPDEEWDSGLTTLLLEKTLG
jgi:ribosomal protein S18 acetylase RimI-like enzyme